MKFIISKLTPLSEIERVVAEAMNAGANCAQVKPAGKRSHLYSLDKLKGFHTVDAEVIFGKRVALGLPMKALDPGLPTPPISVPVTTSADTAKDLAKKILDARQTKVDEPTKPPTPPTPPAPLPVARGTGYMAYIDEHLHTFDSPKQTEEGYVRSKYTVDEVVQRVLVRFPGKNPASVKRVVKVRPRHLEKVKTSDRYDDKHPAPRWKLTGVGRGTGYMHRIDELLNPKDSKDRKTTRQIAEIVCREYGKDMELALKVVRIRISHYAKAHGKEPNFVRQSRKSPPVSGRKLAALQLKKKNLALLKRKK